MAEAIAAISFAGALCNIVDGISKIIIIVGDLRTKWKDADLILLSLASQLTALRSASTKIQEWIGQDLPDAHYQLAMDLEVSINCCGLLISKVESFFCDLASLTEKPLDLHNKFRMVLGSAGPESVQKLIEHQTSALTLLLTACNCKTLSDQQRHLETKKHRKVLDRVKSDSVSLIVHRDNKSFTTAFTDNLSKISHVFDFDSHVFSTKIYERAFRGSVKKVLRQRQIVARPPTGQEQQIVASSPTGRKEQCITYPLLSVDEYILGEDELGKDKLINSLVRKNAQDYLRNYNENEWFQYRWQRQTLCLELLCTIIKRCNLDSEMDGASILLTYSLASNDESPQNAAALDTCVKIWCSAVKLVHMPDPEDIAYLRERVDLEGMVFYINIVPPRLRIYCGNSQARLFVNQMERVLPLSSGGYAPPLPADLCRARAAFCPQHSYELETQLRDPVITLKGVHGAPFAAPQSLQSRSQFHYTQFHYIFDLQDYGNIDSASGPFSELLTRVESTRAILADMKNRGLPKEPDFCFGLRHHDIFNEQVTRMPFPLKNGEYTHLYGRALEEIRELLRESVEFPLGFTSWG